jgi:GGDEF domain-containing protein
MRTGLEQNPVRLETGFVTITVSVGVALADLPIDLDLHKLDGYLEILIRNADTAMYNAKKAGRNRIVIFENES